MATISGNVSVQIPKPGTEVFYVAMNERGASPQAFIFPSPREVGNTADHLEHLEKLRRSGTDATVEYDVVKDADGKFLGNRILSISP